MFKKVSGFYVALVFALFGTLHFVSNVRAGLAPIGGNDIFSTSCISDTGGIYNSTALVCMDVFDILTNDSDPESYVFQYTDVDLDPSTPALDSQYDNGDMRFTMTPSGLEVMAANGFNSATTSISYTVLILPRQFLPTPLRLHMLLLVLTSSLSLQTTQTLRAMLLLIATLT
jgi:hypothetical protein